ncbi:MAG: protein kinase, partial [Acidobacteria bacterium]|nr:protein kinase [Acidobacteriota bacterium]
MSTGAPDARLSNYRLERLLGSGGMGSVYLARDLALDRDVAIKFIAADQAADVSARHRLVREARAAAALDHPNICGVHEVIVEPDGRAAIVMQYVEGETLADALRRGPLDARLAISIAADVAKALVAAHQRGIIHRDIKPQNIIVTPDKQAKILDFGIARQQQIVAASPEAETMATLTSPGVIVGTPAYMSPEQAQQMPIDGRSDLFSLGAVLYECLTGRRPFNGRSSLEVLSAVLHEEPPEASIVQPQLTGQHDEVVRRLLAKHADDRFKSADELLGALRVLSETSRLEPGPLPRTGSRAWPWLRKSRWARVTVGGVAVAASIGLWSWRLPEGAPDPAAADWYRRGTDAIRDGAYHGARLALNEAIKAAPAYAPPYIRLAEAEAELDDPESAQRALLKVDELVPIEARLPVEHRQRFRAVRAMLLRDVDRAVREYELLAVERPRDPGVLLDLGRAQDAAGQSTAARITYEKALEIDPQYAAAHLRRGMILSLEGQTDEALAEFATAERLYRAASNVEGQVEALIRRGATLATRVDVQNARIALERARDLAADLQSRAQEIRARLGLSRLVTVEGRYEAAAESIRVAIDDALRASLETVAAEGLVDLFGPMVLGPRAADVDGYLLRAIQLAEKRGALRTAARAKLQRASMMVQNGRPAEALDVARGPLTYFQSNRYRSYELFALQIMARAHEGLGQYSEARALAEQTLQAATRVKDDSQIALALENLAGQANVMGILPEALEYRSRGLEIHRRQNDVATLAFDLTNTADLLIRVGRHADAARLLGEVEAGAAKGIDAYKQRGRRAALLRAVSATIQHRFNDARGVRELLPTKPGEQPDSNAQLAALVLQYGDAVSAARRPVSPAESPLAGSIASAFGKELRYWQLAGRLARSDARGALQGAEETMASQGATLSYEFEWRIGALGAAAARALKDVERERAFRERAQGGLQR